MLATAHLQYDLDWQAAAQALTKGVALDPNNVQAQETRGYLSYGHRPHE